MEGEDNERIYEPIGEIRPRRFEPPGRTENTRRELEENQEPVRRGRLNQEMVYEILTNGEYNTFLNIVSENLSLIKYRSDQLNKNQVCRLLSSLEAK